MLYAKHRLLIGIAVAVALVAGCAAKGPRAKAQVGALALGEAVLALDNAEYAAYAAGLYDKTAHDRHGEFILKILYAARAYNRAAAEWPSEINTEPATLIEAKIALRRVLDDLERALPNGADGVRRAIRAIQVVIGGAS